LETHLQSSADAQPWILRNGVVFPKDVHTDGVIPLEEIGRGIMVEKTWLIKVSSLKMLAVVKEAFGWSSSDHVHGS
jgi:hypothetical protein